MTRFIRPHPRRSEGQCGQLGGALFAPHCEQNLYANPKRTAKFVTPLPQIRYDLKLFKKYFWSPTVFSATQILTPTGPKSSAKNRVRFNLLSFKGKLLQQTASESFIRAGRVRGNSTLVYVGEDLRSRVSPQHSGKRRLPVWLKRFAQRRFLSTSGCQHPHIPRGGNGGIAQRHAGRWGCGRVPDRAINRRVRSRRPSPVST